MHVLYVDVVLAGIYMYMYIVHILVYTLYIFYLLYVHVCIQSTEPHSTCVQAPARSPLVLCVVCNISSSVDLSTAGCCYIHV